MLTQSMIELCRRRWQAERPFEGHTNESRFLKLKSSAVRQDIKDQARRELHIRGTFPPAV
ncbi:hypothetical protein [Methylobacterium trifolii]|uniref:Transposase n=1 Tax=Methylobacterium trifolii TaxID=1003092 RepID=A0ABQ4TVX8_9HYPH|nr:hypothetical protein [Methylobacterium trifolii]GJE59216.1 hypothetical protein MPOCJGCO_1304 [Methylobacterium trifolii]